MLTCERNLAKKQETLHADHLVQPAALGFGEAGHMEGEAGVV